MIVFRFSQEMSFSKISWLKTRRPLQRRKKKNEIRAAKTLSLTYYSAAATHNTTEKNYPKAGGLRSRA